MSGAGPRIHEPGTGGPGVHRDESRLAAAWLANADHRRLSGDNPTDDRQPPDRRVSTVVQRHQLHHPPFGREYALYCQSQIGGGFPIVISNGSYFSLTHRLPAIPIDGLTNGSRESGCNDSLFVRPHFRKQGKQAVNQSPGNTELPKLFITLGKGRIGELFFKFAAIIVRKRKVSKPGLPLRKVDLRLLR
ncbi:MAG: hypothetical protein R3D32_07225 [Nitratireductor sp.]